MIRVHKKLIGKLIQPVFEGLLSTQAHGGKCYRHSAVCRPVDLDHAEIQVGQRAGNTVLVGGFCIDFVDVCEAAGGEVESWNTWSLRSFSFR